jgi:hypothetical protein
MKAKSENLKSLSWKGIIYLIFLLLSYSYRLDAQEQDSTQTLFKSNINVTQLWTPEIKINSIQGKVGTLIGFYGGALLNRSVLLGISGGVNLSHPTVNYGYFGGMGQYINKSTNLVHFSCQLLIAYGSTKDYENPKSGLMDNFWNISGAGFFLMEPGANLEVNLSKRLTLVTGLSYRYVSGLDENSKNVQKTHVTNKDLSGLNFSIGLKIAEKEKVKH